MPISLNMIFTKKSKSITLPTEFHTSRAIIPEIPEPSSRTRAFRGSMFQNIQSSKKCGSCGGFK